MSLITTLMLLSHFRGCGRYGSKSQAPLSSCFKLGDVQLVIVESFGTGFGFEGGLKGSSCKGCLQKAGLGFQKRVSEAAGFRETSRTLKRLEIEGASSVEHWLFGFKAWKCGKTRYALHVNAERCLKICS